MSDLENCERYADSLYGELEAEKHAHRKDNEYLLAENQRLRDEGEECGKASGRLVARVVTAEAENQLLWEIVGCAEAHFAAETDDEAAMAESEFDHLREALAGDAE